jgi:farnesyl-diphosphate farnesyltransferase
MDFRSNALEILKHTSRTFYIPISRLPEQLQSAVASAYLCMRAIDEVEDSDILDLTTKAKLLRAISLNLQSQAYNLPTSSFSDNFQPYQDLLPEVTLRISEWSLLADDTIAPRIWDATAAMADRMAYWAENNWQIKTKEDLDRYTFSVAGAVGLLLSDLWNWYDGTTTSRSQAIGFGRGLQAVNIIRNRKEDLKRGVDFFPEGWSFQDMHQYARYQLNLGKLYTDNLPNSPALDFCQIPLALAFGTLEAIALGKEKLTRTDVLSLVENLINIKSA